MVTPKLSRDEINLLEPWFQEGVSDYHNFSHRGSNAEHRKRLGIGPYYLNAATCLNCGYFIRSRNRHDMVTCRCVKISVDGGSWYIRRVGALSKDSHIDHIEYFEDAKHE